MVSRAIESAMYDGDVARVKSLAFKSDKSFVPWLRAVGICQKCASTQTEGTAHQLRVASRDFRAGDPAVVTDSAPPAATVFVLESTLDAVAACALLTVPVAA